MKGVSGNGKGGRYHYYTHSKPKDKSVKKKAKCNVHTIPASKIEEAILNRLSVLAENKALFRKIVEKSNSSGSKSMEKLNSLITSNHNKVREINTDIDNLMNILAKNKSHDSTILDKVQKLNIQLTKIKAEVETLENQRKAITNVKINIDSAAQFFKNFSQNIMKFNKHLQKEAVRSIIKKITLSENLITAEIYCGYQLFLNNPNFLEKFKFVKDTNIDMFKLLTQKESSSYHHGKSCSSSMAPTPPTSLGTSSCFRTHRIKKQDLVPNLNQEAGSVSNLKLKILHLNSTRCWTNEVARL